MKDYLGDGVYVDVERGMLKLTTEDGTKAAASRGATNTIYLEPDVYISLLNYVGRINAAAKAERDRKDHR